MVDKIKTYSTKETAEILGIKERAVQTRCKKDNIRKKDNKYLITDLIIANWKQKEETNATPNANANATQLDIEIEALKIENVRLKEELAEYEIAENERIEVFTNEEYQLFQTRLIEWRTQQKENEHQQELFNAKIITLEQSADHYKNQFQYQKEQSTRILTMHEKLLETLSAQTKDHFIETTIRAKNTDWKKE
jgi:hypothetical protein